MSFGASRPTIRSSDQHDHLIGPVDMPVATQAPPTQPPITPDNAWRAAACPAVRRSLHKDPAHRFADAVEFIAALEGARA